MPALGTGACERVRQDAAKEVRHDDGRLWNGNDGDDVGRRPVEPGIARDTYRAALGRHRSASAESHLALRRSRDRAPVINWLIDVSLRNRFLVIAFFVLVAGWGYWALRTTPIDAIPDLSDNQVIVFTDWPGRSPQEVEDQITYPLSRECPRLMLNWSRKGST
jgi:hypothetical protein